MNNPVDTGRLKQLKNTDDEKSIHYTGCTHSCCNYSFNGHPYFFKGDILQIIEKQSAKYINAKLKIGDMNLSMFKSFPNLNVALKEVMIELGENPEDVLGVNPLQSSIEVKLKADYANTDSLAVIEKISVGK